MQHRPSGGNGHHAGDQFTDEHGYYEDASPGQTGYYDESYVAAPTLESLLSGSG